MTNYIEVHTAAVAEAEKHLLKAVLQAHRCGESLPAHVNIWCRKLIAACVELRAAEHAAAPAEEDDAEPVEIEDGDYYQYIWGKDEP